MEEKGKVPFEAALSKGIEKLTSEIFIFLLCYTILLIGMAVLGTNLPKELRTLLYILPVLGIGSYLLLQGQKLKKKTRYREMEGNERIAELEAKIKDLEINAEKVSASVVAAIEGLPDDVSPEVTKALGEIKQQITAKDITEGSTVAGISFKDDLSKLAKSLDAETQNVIKSLMMYFQRINKDNNNGGKRLRSLIKDIQELNDENIKKLSNMAIDLRREE